MTMRSDVHDDGMAQRLRKLLQKYVDEGKIPGAVAVVAGPESDDDEPLIVSVGARNVASGAPVDMHTIFRVYSLTKPVTSVAALMLAERGLLSLNDAVADYIPAFADAQVVVKDPAVTSDGAGSLPTEPPLTPPTIRDLLTHTSGIGGIHVLPEGPVADLYRAGRFDDRDQTLEELADKLARIPLLFHPGQQWRYGLSSDVLARVIEVASGQSFGDFLREHIFDPLDMPDTGFYVQPENADRLATMYGPAADGGLRPLQALGANTFTKPPRLEAGGSGLLSTPRDFLRFARMLLGRGTGQGRRLLHPETVKAMATNQLPDDLLPYRLPWAHAAHFTNGAGFGLGVRVLLDPTAAGVPGSVGEYGWAGAANTFLWVDPVRQRVFLLFTQAFPFLHTDLDQRFKQLVESSADGA